MTREEAESVTRTSAPSSLQSWNIKVISALHFMFGKWSLHGFLNGLLANEVNLDDMFKVF